MFWIDFTIGAVFMLVCLLVYRFPKLIAGLNTMSKKSLAKVNVEVIKRVVRNVFLIGGAAIMLWGVLSTFMHVSESVLVMVNSAVIIAVVVAMIVACVVLMVKYDPGTLDEEDKEEKAKNERRDNRIAISFVIGIFALMSIIFVSVVRNSKPATVEVTEDYITAKGGSYGINIPVADVTMTTVLTRWPDIAVRTNGFYTRKVSIGHFRLKNDEDCMLFLCTNGGPVLEVRTSDGGLYYLNCATEEETHEMITRVNEVMGKRMNVSVSTGSMTLGFLSLSKDPSLEVPCQMEKL